MQDKEEKKLYSYFTDEFINAAEDAGLFPPPSPLENPDQIKAKLKAQ